MVSLSTSPMPIAPPRRILYETLGVIALMALVALTPFKGIAVLLPVIYFFAEARVRRRTWAELGFKPREFLENARMNWAWILLVGVVIQGAVIVSAQFLAPAFLEHVRARLATLDNLQLLSVIGILFISTLAEEITFRAFFQERLAWFMGTPTAILIAAFLFGMMHLSDGAPWMVTLDIALVVFDGVLYGIIFARGKNVLTAWLAHFLADVTGILFLLYWIT